MSERVISSGASFGITQDLSGMDFKIVIKAMILKESFTLNNPKQYCNYCNYKKNMYEAPNIEANDSDCPCNEQDYCDDVK